MFSVKSLLLTGLLLGGILNASSQTATQAPAAAAPPLPAPAGVQAGSSGPAPSSPAASSPAASSSENWDDLALHGKPLPSEPVIVGQIDARPEFTRELLRVQWRHADPIDLYIVRPAGVAKPPVVIYLYGYPGEAVRFLNDSLCQTVTRGGFAAVGFSSRLTGQRYHDVPMKWFISDLPRSLVGTTHDVQMVLNYLAERGDFDLSRVGVFGEGSGGTIALLAASVDPRIKAVDVLDPWGDWPAWLAASQLVPDAERPDYLKPSFLESVAPFDPLTVLPRLTRLPLRLQQTLWDDSKTPAASRQAIAHALPASAELAVYKNQQEYIDKVGSNGKMLDWMHAKLPPSVP
jgi:cephalosporin-C deacetylase-like acetyl esterase